MFGQRVEKSPNPAVQGSGKDGFMVTAYWICLLTTSGLSSFSYFTLSLLSLCLFPLSLSSSLFSISFLFHPLFSQFPLSFIISFLNFLSLSSSRFFNLLSLSSSLFSISSLSHPLLFSITSFIISFLNLFSLLSSLFSISSL